MADQEDLSRAWHELEGVEAGTALVQMAEEYRHRDTWRQELTRLLGSALEGRQLTALSASGYTADFVKWPSALARSDFDTQLRNYARKFVDTQVSKIAARDAPKPALVVSDGNWELKRKATLNTRLLEAEYDQRQGLYANVHELAHAAYAMALVTGTVAMKVFAYPEEKRTVVELHDTMDMFLDDTDLTYGPPMTYGEITWFNPHRLARLEDKKFKQQIFDAAEERTNNIYLGHPGPARTLLVPVFEGWYMGSDDSPGKYLRCLRDGTILNDEPTDQAWERDEPPFVFMRPVRALYGFWGIPWLAAVYPEIIAANEVLSAMVAAHGMVPKNITYVQENQQDTIDKIQNAAQDLVAIVPIPNLDFVKTENPAAFNRVDLELLANLERGMEDTLGVSASIAGARREPGLPSAAAQRESVGKYDDRQARAHREYVQVIAVDLGRHLLEAQRALYKANRSLKRRWQGEFFAKDIEAKDILDVDVEALHLQIRPVSEKKGTPEERVQLADELLAKQAITLETYMAVLEHYDVPGETRVSKTQRRWVAWQMDQWLFADDEERSEPGFYKGPRVWFRKVDALIQVMDGLMAAELDNAPQPRLKYFLDFIAALSAMISAETPPPVQGDGGMNAPANPLSPIPGVGPVPGGNNGQQQAGSKAGPPGGGPGQGSGPPNAGPPHAQGR